MSVSPRLLCPALALAAVAFAIPARADQAKAAACARGLTPEAEGIYQAIAPTVTPSTDLPAALKTKVTAMVFEGEVRPATARASATAAYHCLRDLK